MEACSSDHAILVQEVLFILYCLLVLKLSCSQRVSRTVRSLVISGLFVFSEDRAKGSAGAKIVL
jgi:hypothetical protein